MQFVRATTHTRDEVESGVKRNSSGNLLAGRQFHFDYDDMGNRTEMRYGGDGSGNGLRTVGYTPNQVNQYDAITHPGIAQILGHSPDPGPITATPDQQGATTVQGSLWRAEVKETNASNGAWADVEVTQEINGNPEVIDDGKLWIPHANAQPQYDLDGNLREDDRWIHTWNAENRLVSMTPTTQAITGGHPWMRLSFEYDYMGRRIHKMVETGSSSSPVVTLERLFLYDAWNLIAEIDATPSTPETFATYLWGPDVASHGTVGPASSMQHAGGVGGLLAVSLLSSVSPSSVFLPTYDGNGNIIAWVGGSGASAGDVVERIDYDPFGRVLTRQGGVPGLHFGFSTKYTDNETGLCYYGYRYYDPVTGRWPSRDPIEERGGIILYGFTYNSPSNSIDVHGEWVLKVVVIAAVVGATVWGMIEVKKAQNKSQEAAKVKEKGYDAISEWNDHTQSDDHAEELLDEYKDKVHEAGNHAINAMDKFPHTIFTGPACYSGPGLTDLSSTTSVLETVDDVRRALRLLKSAKCSKCCVDDLGVQLKIIKEHMTKLGYVWVPNNATHFGAYWRRPRGGGQRAPEDVNSLMRELLEGACDQ